MGRTHITQIHKQLPTTGAEPMQSAHEALLGVLRSIREQADSVLKEIENRAERKSLSWKCSSRGHTHLTRPAPAEVAVPCPKCGGETFHCI